MSLRILNVAFPFAPLTEDPVGGAEQVLVNIDRALVQAGHRSWVVAPSGSHVWGQLIPIELERRAWNESVRRQTEEAVRAAVAATCAHAAIDLVHLHGADFYAYLPPEPIPALVTLHMPLSSYPTGVLNSWRRGMWFNTVSQAQADRAWRGLHLLGPIENGVALDVFDTRVPREGFAFALGRICPEKGFHHALDASVRAQIPLVLAGTLYRWPEHISYFEQHIAPRLDAQRRWIGAVSGHAKRQLLSAARCVLIPSLAEETSSLVAMESLAAGTPVIAFRAGALPRIVEHGVTGYIVSNAAEMAAALQIVDRLDPENCRHAAQRFDLKRSMNGYLELYQQIIAGSVEVAHQEQRCELACEA